ncbi:MAG: class I SAM-dependent methyltransferase [Prolixibacteraceae bacterium]|jgi:2-polyprenyl-3-methyl-5-hydroxy-6-metoxy-1,4-benzoquinol methylase|nr:class I SAM-dependent methyltransferase [Prolixibacteraceae bacterium]
MKELWNARYSKTNYVYGLEPNNFFKQEIQKLSPGKILLPAEGEGRNAVYAAKLGWEVTAFDISTEGKKKADKLAVEIGVSINYLIADFEQFDLQNKAFDCIALTFVHTIPQKRITNHKLVQKWLNPKGTIILQGFSKEQINYQSGGPKEETMLFSPKELEVDFKDLSIVMISKTEENLNEGEFHKGKASLINLVAKKNK